MLDIFPLAIFPANTLANSIIPVVWVGMFVVCFFNLRLGWVLTGLVVPGYVVPLMLIKPWSAGVIFLESILTYFLVWFFSEYLSRRAPWSNFFGRDRFFALVLCSIFIRLLFDGWLLPIFGEWLNQALNINFDYHNHLHSFGLIIVALIANQFWNTGFVRGLIPLTVILTVTLLIVRYGLMELTNFGLSNISYLYEDMASSILATPKAYIILISTALLASRMNLRYGWDFNGILIPSLMALQWYQPIKILATVVETGVILLLVQWLLKTPWLKKMTIEGARKILLFFNVSFIYKVSLGYAMSVWLPEVKVTDYFGFGYLLSTLMAVKIHDKAILARLTRATLQTSLASVIFASIIGYGLTWLPISQLFIKDLSEQPIQSIENKYLNEELSSVLKKEEIQLYQAKINDRFTVPLAQEQAHFSQAINLLKSYLKQNDSVKLQQAKKYLEQVNYRLDIIQSRYLYLHEKAPVKGWGIYVFDMQKPSSLAISIPATLDEPGILDASITLFQTMNAGSLAISGSSRWGSTDKRTDVLHNKQTFFHQFHHLVNRYDSLQVRSYDALMARKTSGSRRSGTGLNTILWAKQSLPSSLNLVTLKQLIDDYQIEWTEPAFENQQRKSSGQGFAELVLTQQDIRKLLFKPLLIKQKIDYVEQDMRLEGYLQEWILNSKKLIAAKGSELYQRPKLEELLFLDEQVVTPLLKLVLNYSDKLGWTTKNQDSLQVIAWSAKVMGYQLIHYKNRETAQQYLILTEQTSDHQRYWGTYVFRLDKGDNYLVQIPRPLYEINSFEYGISLFERIKAKVLMIGTTHPYANQDGSANLVSPTNVSHLFNLINQVTLREHHDIDMLVVNSRAFSYRTDQPIPEADVLFSQALGVTDQQQLEGLSAQLFSSLKADSLSVQLVNGSKATSGYEVGGTSLANYLKATENKNFVMLWLSPHVRAGYRQQDQNTWQTAQFNAFEIEQIKSTLLAYVQQIGFSSDYSENISSIKPLLFAYMDNPDIMRLQQIIAQAKIHHYHIKRLLDVSSKQAFLLIHHVNGKIIAIANLLPRGRSIQKFNQQVDIDSQVIQFIGQRNALMETEVTQ